MVASVDGLKPFLATSLFGKEIFFFFFFFLFCGPLHISGTSTARESCACSMCGAFDAAFAKLLRLFVILAQPKEGFISQLTFVGDMVMVLLIMIACVHREVRNR